MRKAFPSLSVDGYEVKSPETGNYNCIAWAVGDDSRWWWPNSIMGYWPSGIQHDDSQGSFVQLFRSLGYEKCESEELAEGYEKVAIYAVGGQVKHVARQLKSGKWTSKLGDSYDIEHSLSGLVGNRYGIVVQILCRRINTTRSD